MIAHTLAALVAAGVPAFAGYLLFVGFAQARRNGTELIDVWVWPVAGCACFLAALCALGLAAGWV